MLKFDRTGIEYQHFNILFYFPDTNGRNFFLLGLKCFIENFSKFITISFLSLLYIKISAELITYAFAVFMRDISCKERHIASSVLNNKLKVYDFTETELA